MIVKDHNNARAQGACHIPDGALGNNLMVHETQPRHEKGVAGSRHWLNIVGQK